MSQQITRKNHYVPEWYQRRFLSAGSNELFYLSLSPEKQLPDGRTIRYKEINRWSPSRCFCEQDLYTTQFGEILNDEVERLLMGSLDTKGAKAVSSLSNGNPNDFHDALQPFFEYLDAQKLRTPKGLDWIKSKYPTLTQVDLMVEMQSLRQMHCTMWAEGVREIVSAENSDVKFIVTDHPVTIYNSAYPPESSACIYPDDPSIELIGTQTLFVLDENHCLILTNLEYANNPKSVDHTARRSNARYRGGSIVKTDAYIRTRKFSRDEVVAVNHVLKSRAHKFIAAGSKEWLYPEQHFISNWSEIGEILLPRDELWRFGGEIYVSYKDGSVHYQDEFGRTSGAHKYLQKKVQANLNSNDLCGCGSGRKYKKCCKNRLASDRPAWDTYSIRERNLIFTREIQNILGLDKGNTWEDVRRNLSDQQVKEIHEVFGSLWPQDTNFASLLPRPDDSVSRGVFLGIIDPRTVGANVIGLLGYFDELVIPNPFINPVLMRPEYSPTHSPAQHKEQTLKNVILLLTLEPLINAGIIHLIPDPTDYNAELRETVRVMAEHRAKSWIPSEEDMRQFHYLNEDDFKRSLARLPVEAQKYQLLKSDPNMKEELVEKLLTYIQQQQLEDPLALLQPMVPGEDNAQLKAIKGFNLEIALFLAGLTGSFLYTDALAHWGHLHAHTLANTTSNGNLAQPIKDSIKAIQFPLQHNVTKLIEDKISGDQFGELRKLIAKLLSLIHSNSEVRIQNPLAQELIDLVSKLRKKRSETILDIQFEFSAPVNGFETNNVRRLIMTFGRDHDFQIASKAILIHISQAAA